jgi:hypothetical protein
MINNPNFIEPASILPALSIFTAMFVLLNLLFRVITMLINVSHAFVFPTVMIILLISSYYGVLFFIKKHRRYFLMSELLFISIGSVMSVWIINAFLDGVLLLNQSLAEALLNSAISMLFQSVPIVFAYAYLGRYMLHRFLVNEPDVSDQDER